MYLCFKPQVCTYLTSSLKDPYQSVFTPSVYSRHHFWAAIASHLRSRDKKNTNERESETYLSIFAKLLKTFGRRSYNKLTLIIFISPANFLI